MKKYTIREIKKWRKFWEDKGYTLTKLSWANEARVKRAFHKNVIRGRFSSINLRFDLLSRGKFFHLVYRLDYVSVRPKRGKKWEQVGCIRVVPLGSYYPQIWAKSWFMKP